MFEKEMRDIDSSQIDSVVDAVVIGIAKEAIVPRFEIATEH